MSKEISMTREQTNSPLDFDNGKLSGFFGSLRRAWVRLFLSDEVARPSDLVALIPNPKGDGLCGWIARVTSSRLVTCLIFEFDAISDEDGLNHVEMCRFNEWLCHY